MSDQRPTRVDVNADVQRAALAVAEIEENLREAIATYALAQYRLGRADALGMLSARGDAYSAMARAHGEVIRCIARIRVALNAPADRWVCDEGHVLHQSDRPEPHACADCGHAPSVWRLA